MRVLAENGCEVVTPKQVKCCGMPQIGYGDMEEARALARHNIDVLEKLDVDAIVTDCATCGSTLKEYGATILAQDPEYADRARALSQRVQDIAEFLASIPLREPKHSFRVKVTYHDPCHLRRGQDVWRQPRQLLQLAGCELVEMKEPDWCCGSAGTQALTHHGDVDADSVPQNVECRGHRRSGHRDGMPRLSTAAWTWSAASGLEAQVVHPVQVLDWAYRMDEQDSMLTKPSSESWEKLSDLSTSSRRRRIW